MMWLAGLLVSQNGIPVPKKSTEVIHAGKVKPCCTQCHVSVDDCRSNSACMATIGASMAAEMICLGYSNWLGLISLYSFESRFFSHTSTAGSSHAAFKIGCVQECPRIQRLNSLAESLGGAFIQSF